MDNKSTTLKITNESSYTIKLVHNELGRISEYFSGSSIPDRALVIVDEQVHHYHRDWIEGALGNILGIFRVT